MQPSKFRGNDQSAVTRLRADLATSLTLYLMTGRVRRADFARALGVPQGRVTDLLQGRLGLFSLEELVTMATNAGLTPKLSIHLI